MDIKALMKSGIVMISDTKARKPANTAKNIPATPEMAGAGQNLDPHQAFVKRTIDGKPPKAKVVEDIKKFIEMAEKEL